MFKKALYLGLFIFSVNVVLSTLSCTRKTKIKSYCSTISAGTLTGYDESNSRTLSDSDNAVVANTLNLRLKIRSESELCMGAPMDHDLSFFNRAYAAVAPNTFNLNMRLDSIVGFDVVSDKVYDDAHPAGASLKGVFSADDDYILRSLGGTNSIFNFYCEQAPTETGIHTFTVKLIKNNGDVITVNSIPIKLLK
jgi:hypothetical protein